MKLPKKTDILISVAFSITVLCLAATLVMQNVQKSKIYKAQYGFTQSGTTLVSTTAATVYTTEKYMVGAIDYSQSETQAATVTTTSAPKTTAKATTTKQTTTNQKAAKSVEIDSVLIVNKNSKKIHSSTCSYAANMNDENKITISSDELQQYLDNGYELCGRCRGCK